MVVEFFLNSDRYGTRLNMRARLERSSAGVHPPFISHR